MKKPSWLGSATFRLTLTTAPLFLLAGWALLALVFFNTRTIMVGRVDLGLTAESGRLSRDLAGADRARILDALTLRIAAERGSARLYRLTAGDGAPLVDNFTLVSGAAPAAGRFADVAMTRDPADGAHEARLLGVALGDGLTLVLGRDLTEEDQFRAVIAESLLIGALVTALLALVAGAVTSRAVTRRLAGFNASAARMLHGHIEERMPIVGADDEFDHLAVNINDALDRIAALMEATRTVTDAVAHDLRGPLSRVRGRLEYLLISAAPPAALEAALAESVADLDQILETFEALLAIARLEHGVAPEFETLDVVPLLDDLVDYFRPLAEDKGLALIVEATGPAWVEADRHLLFQALSNVVDNALRYTPAGGRIAVSVRTAGGRVAIRVVDDGPGIPADQRHRVTERFVRLDSSRHQPGHGLGLAVVEAVVRHHGGTLDLADAGPGLAVTIALPAAAPAPDRRT